MLLAATRCYSLLLDATRCYLWKLVEIGGGWTLGGGETIVACSAHGSESERETQFGGGCQTRDGSRLFGSRFGIGEGTQFGGGEHDRQGDRTDRATTENTRVKTLHSKPEIGRRRAQIKTHYAIAKQEHH
jgi:hypothetical protein